MYCSSKFSPNYFLIYDIVFNVCKIVHMEAVLISPVYKYHHFGESSCGVLGILKSKQFTRDRKKKTYAFAINCKSVQFSSVAQLCPTLCNPMNRSTPGLPVHHRLLEFTQTHLHRVGDAIQPSHPLLSPSPPAPNPSQHQGLSQ